MSICLSIFTYQHCNAAGKLFLGGLLFLLAITSNIYAADTTESQTLTQQRAEFKAARDALRSGKQGYYKRLAKRLEDYPLYPYLEYWDINRHLTPRKAKRVEEFLSRHADTPLASRLRYRWLKKLAQQGQWQTFIDFYLPNSSTKTECYYRRALYKTGDKTAAFDGIEKLWLRGRSQPKVCDPLFAAWREAGLMTEDLAWQRIELAMKSRQPSLARYLERFISKEKRQWAQLWRKVHRHPEIILTDSRLKKDTPITRAIIAHGVKRISRRNPSQAAETWNRLIMNFAFSEAVFDETETHIAIALARKKAPEAMHWLANLDSDANKEVREWRVLTAINQDDWEDSLFWIDQLLPEEQNSNRWLYWRARALEETGKINRAQAIYSDLAQKRDYYGFIAADRLDASYHFKDRPLTFSRDEIIAIESQPSLIRARELYAIGDVLNARREWYSKTKKMDTEELLKAASIAHQWGWHDRAIHTLGKARYLDDLEMRFPLLHREQVTNQAGVQKIDPSWAYAVIRQESAFAADARSPKGAMGLMQIMPRTGRLIARDLNTKLNNSRQLLNANTNIRFGISYLRKVMDRFKQNTVLATAAYNAGSQRVKSWMPEEEAASPDRWIENVPFKETRNYLKQVLAFTAIYDERMKRPVTPLKLRMPEIEPRQPRGKAS